VKIAVLSVDRGTNRITRKEEMPNQIFPTPTPKGASRLNVSGQQDTVRTFQIASVHASTGSSKCSIQNRSVSICCRPSDNQIRNGGRPRRVPIGFGHSHILAIRNLDIPTVVIVAGRARIECK
jgi:hypothetical protein